MTGWGCPVLSEPAPRAAGGPAPAPPPRQKDELHREIRILGDALGQILKEADPGLYEDVEDLRQAVIAARRRTGGRDPAAVVAALSPARAEQLARAFTVYFHLVNLAEGRARERALWARDARAAWQHPTHGGASSDTGDGSPEGEPTLAPGPAPGSVANPWPAAESLASDLAGLEVRPVLTAHPTEARRRAFVEALGRIHHELDRLAGRRTGPAGHRDAHRRLLEEVAILWGTDQLRRHRPQPLDEVRTAMAVFDSSLFELVPALYRRLAGWVAEPAADRPRPATQIPAFLHWGSWIGADQDGNPAVTPAVTWETMRIQSEHVFRALAAAVRRVGRALTLDEHRCPPSEALRAALEKAGRTQPRLLAGIARSAPGEPHRQYLLLVAARLDATRVSWTTRPPRGARMRSGGGPQAGGEDGAACYDDVRQFEADLVMVQDSLASGGAARPAFGELQHLRWQAETFGFHLAELEVRGHSRTHASALDDLLGPGAAHDVELLDDVARTAGALRGRGSPASRQVLATFRTMAQIQRRWGPDACRRYVVSFTHDAASLVGVRALARLARGDRALTLDVVPLFESEHDLRAAADVLERWHCLPSTRTWLAGNGGRLEVMLGYSDSAKEVGPVTAALALDRAQQELAAWADRRGLRLMFFHGRGGALGRGGGPAARAILASPPASVQRRLKVTEQGEVIHDRYGTPTLGVDHLEQVTRAVLLASTAAAEQAGRRSRARFADLARHLTDSARRAYSALVNRPGFAEFTGRATPLAELADLHMGSRPPWRAPEAATQSSSLSELRAIPWVLAWAQARCNLPGWYGLGSGLEAVRGLPGGTALLREAYAQWPLFATILDNAQMALAKADRGFAERYLDLGGEASIAETILAEFDRTVAGVLTVTSATQLLAGDDVLARAVAVRAPYVDALSHLQLRALGTLRQEGNTPEARHAHRLLLLTAQGLAAGLQNTG